MGLSKKEHNSNTSSNGRLVAGIWACSYYNIDVLSQGVSAERSLPQFITLQVSIQKDKNLLAKQSHLSGNNL